MFAHLIVYVFLAILLAAMIYVIGMPWKLGNSKQDRTRSWKH